MRALLVAATILVSIAPNLAAEVRVFIAPRSPIIPVSGRVTLDVYWFNEGERPAPIPGVGQYGLTTIIRSRTGKTLPRVEGSALVMSHGPADRGIAPRTLVRDEITTKVRAKAGEFVELTADFALARGRRFESNTVLLVKRR